jgi:anthraniloyl-CoA monooxygenase
VRINVLGGGPGGLYAALLLKKSNPAAAVRVSERNPRGVTYGWGVVFSDQTLGALREADHRSYVAVTDQFVRWDAIDVCFKGVTTRSGGHGFAAISRRALLALLEERCTELGVDVAWGEEIDDVELLRECDLLVGADGVNSLIRAWGEDVFRPVFREHSARYIWFGSQRVLDSFTFSFRESEHGLFQLHAYPFDGRTSTFIVECAETVWRRAGLDEASERAGIAFCEKLFSADLGGMPLLSNNSKWINFVTLRNRAWHRDNVVILGDAAHTAHFSIGSGTKLAMEDAVALANAVELYPDDLPAALGRYEMERKPVVDAFQRAALESAHYFENVARVTHFDPPPFSCNLLTRSGRISYDNLRRRDVVYVEAVDRWHAEQAVGHRRNVASSPLWQPFELRDVRIANRLVVAPCSSEPSSEGVPPESYLDALVGAAEAGAGLVLTDPMAVSPEGRITPGCPGLYSKAHAARWETVTERVRELGGRTVGHLSHAGRRGASRWRSEGLDVPLGPRAWPLLAPSPIPYTAASQSPHDLKAGADAVLASFEESAARARTAGFDALMLNVAHGYLLASCLSPLTNRRRDELGAGLAGRLEFPLAALRAARAGWGDGPLVVALNADDLEPGGWAVADAVTAARTMYSAGADLFLVLSGYTTPRFRPSYDRFYQVPLSEQVRAEARVPTIAAGGLATTDDLNTVLAAGRADLCVLMPSVRLAPVRSAG